MEKFVIKESELTSLVEKVISNELKRKSLKETIKNSLTKVLKEDNIAFPHGGQISGKHEQPIKDKDFKSNFPAGKTDNQKSVDKEWQAKAIGRLFGVEWSQNPNPNIPVDWLLSLLASAIKSWRIKNFDENPNIVKNKLDSFKSALNSWPQSFAEHFGINPDSDESIISFLDNKSDSLLGNIDEYRKLMLQGRAGVQEAKKKVKEILSENVIEDFLTNPEVNINKQGLGGQISSNGILYSDVVIDGNVKELPLAKYDNGTMLVNNSRDVSNIIDDLTQKIKGHGYQIKYVSPEYIIDNNIQEANKKSSKKKKFDKVMGEFGAGTLKTPNGKKVTDQKQALAIAYSESGLDEQKVKVYNIVENVLKSINETKILITFVDGTERNMNISSNDPQFIKNNFGTGNKFTVDGKVKSVKSVDILSESKNLKENLSSGNVQWLGVDRSLEISLFEYGFIAEKESEDELFVIYQINDDAFGTGYKTISEIDGYVLGTEFPDDEDIQSFLNYVGNSKEEWIQLNSINKLSDLFNYWGYENIMGTDYNPWSREQTVGFINKKAGARILESKLNEKWKGDVEVKKTGEHAGKTIDQLQKELTSLKNKSKKYQDNNKPIPESLKDLEKEIMFAIRAKKNWKGGIKEGVAQNNPKIEKYVNQINELIAQAFDSAGDPIGVVDPTSTWEEPYIYEPIIYRNGALKIISYSNYQPGKINTDIVRSSDMEYDGIPTLQLLSRMYKKALKNYAKNREAEENEESLRKNRNGVFGSIH